MIRRFNYTDRKRIDHNRIEIALMREEGRIKSFDATIDFEGMRLPANAVVYVEAYHKTDLMRYLFG